jgi:hypothetical protein
MEGDRRSFKDKKGKGMLSWLPKSSKVGMAIGTPTNTEHTKKVTLDPDTGNIDLSGLPEELRAQYQQILQTVRQEQDQKKKNALFDATVESDGGDSPVVRRSRQPGGEVGPKVQKGLKMEEILVQMRKMAFLRSPWEIYSYVSVAPCPSVPVCLGVPGGRQLPDTCRHTCPDTMSHVDGRAPAGNRGPTVNCFWVPTIGFLEAGPDIPVVSRSFI